MARAGSSPTRVGICKQSADPSRDRIERMVEMDAETEMSRTEAARFFREFANKLEGAGRVTAEGDQETTVIGNEETTTTEREGAPTPGSTSPQTMTVIVGGESATVVLPERLLLDVEVGSRSGLLESGVDQRIAFELTWEVEEFPEDDSIEVV